VLHMHTLPRCRGTAAGRFLYVRVMGWLNPLTTPLRHIVCVCVCYGNGMPPTQLYTSKHHHHHCWAWPDDASRKPLQLLSTSSFILYFFFFLFPGHTNASLQSERLVAPKFSCHVCVCIIYSHTDNREI
jgi:hypothetical protein